MISNGHLSFSDRVAIENMLNDGFSIKDIEKDIKRTSSCILKEIGKHTNLTFPSSYNNRHSCLKWDSCNVKGYDCFKTCKNIEYKLCSKLEKSPHVCNGCSSKSGCRYVKK